MSDETALPLPVLFGNSSTSLETLAQLGWQLESNGYSTYLRHSSGRVYGVPLWALQLRDAAVKNAKESVQRDIRSALGIDTP